jgi:hypothetical protein
VATHQHFLTYRPIHDAVGLSVREPPARGLGGVPFLGVVGCELAKVLDVVLELVVCRVAAVAGADGRAEIEESGIFGEGVKLGEDHKGTCQTCQKTRDSNCGPHLCD